MTEENMSKPLNAYNQMAENTPKKRARRKEGASFMDKPDWLWRHSPFHYGQTQVRSVEIERHSKGASAVVRFTHGSTWYLSDWTVGDLMWTVKDTIERETGMTWRKGPR
jgi:hypothetical protein